jgi:hypothetical protein
MLKYALLAGAMIASVPALAQEATNVPQTAPQAEQKADPAQDSAATTLTQAPADMAPAETTAAAPTTPAAPSAAAPAQAATAQPAPTTEAAPAPAAQVANVVKTEFPSYDRNSDGNLSDAEFTEWMSKLRKATEPSLDTASPEVQTWMKGAFAQADVDKNKSVNQTELTAFLSAASQAS